MSNTGKVFFVVAVLIGITSLLHLKRGDYWLAAFTAAVSGFEFFLAYTTKASAQVVKG